MNSNNFNVLAWKPNVLAASTGNVDITTAIFPIIDGIQLTYEDRVLLKNQNNTLENGIYQVAYSGYLIIDTDSSQFQSYFYGAFVRVLNGNVNINTEWYIAPIKVQLHLSTPKIFVPSPFTGGGGGGGGSDKNYVHNQGIASTTWNVVHNLNKYPSVTIVDSSNREVEGNIVHLTLNTLTITFSSGFAGKAFIN